VHFSMPPSDVLNYDGLSSPLPPNPRAGAVSFVSALFGLRAWGPRRGASFPSWGNHPHGRRVVAEVDDVAGFHFDVEVDRRRGSRRDASEAEHEA
jgi:hypothetical protein